MFGQALLPSPQQKQQQGQVIAPAKQGNHIGDEIHRAEAIEQDKDHQPLGPPGSGRMAKALIETAHAPPDEAAFAIRLIVQLSINSWRSRWI